MTLNLQRPSNLTLIASDLDFLIATLVSVGVHVGGLAIVDVSITLQIMLREK